METLPNVQIPNGYSSHSHSQESVTVKIIVDLEDHCINGIPHPHHDPGTIVYYLLKVNDHKYETRKTRMHGREIIELDSKSPENFLLYQVRRKHGESYLEPIGRDEVVDFTADGIESFVVKPRTYRFSIGKKGYESVNRYLTVRQILNDFAHADPATNTLSTKAGGEYKNLDEVIDLECVNHFVLFNDEPTPVS